MNNTKKSILIYFDNYPMIITLSPEQRGWLFTALMVYGDRLTRDVEVPLEEVLEQFPQLSPETRLVCGFMAGNILRDTQKWLNRQQSRQQYSRPAAAQTGKRTYAPPVPAEDQEKRAREDMERMRRFMEEMKEA